MNDPQYWADFGGGMSVAGVASPTRVSQLGAVQAVRYGLSSALSTLPVMVYRRGAKGARTPLPDHPLTRLLGARPNDQNSPAEFIGEIAWHLSYYRNAYCRILPPATGWPEALTGSAARDPSPRACRWSSAVSTAISITPSIRRRRSCRARSSRPRPIATTRSGICAATRCARTGCSASRSFKPRANVFGRAIAVHEYGDIWFPTAASPAARSSIPAPSRTRKIASAFLEAWREAGTGRNRHKDRLLTHGVKYQPIKVTNAEAQLLETEEQSDTAVFGLWSFRRIAPAGSSARPTTTSSSSRSISSPIAWRRWRSRSSRRAERDLLLDNDDNSCSSSSISPDCCAAISRPAMPPI
jgi:hypothetical protein